MKYFFLSGLPRSGNTLLSSILNQNPDIKVSPNSFLCEHLYQTSMFFHNEKFKNFPNQESLDNLISSSFDSYYQNWNAKYIIDRGVWGTPINLYLLKRYLKNEIKIICTVRDIIEIIASFIKVSKNRLIDELNYEIQNNVRFNESYKTEIELLCEIVMRPNGQLEQFLFSLNNLLKEENRNYLHIVEYRDLVNSPENTIKKIYNFLNIPHYNHNYNNIEQFTINGIYYNDSLWKGDLHKVNEEIQFSPYKVEDIIPQNIIQKYSNMEFWRNF
jgi:sulfotransferase